MRLEREFALRELIERQVREFESKLESLPHGATEAPEDVLAARVELDDLRNELDFLRGNFSGSGETPSLVRAPLNPPPHFNSGAVALPEPDEPEA